VCKHGNGGILLVGTADVLEALVWSSSSERRVRRCVEEAGMGFCFAQRFHPACASRAVRRELGLATVFNFLGPLATRPGRSTSWWA